MIKKISFLAVASVVTCAIYANDDYKQIDAFSVDGKPVTIYLEPGDVLERNRKVVFESTEGNQLTLTIRGNYKILTKK